jgi:hypothetical protein
MAVEADIRRVVADVDDDFADELFEVDPGTGGDFAADDGDCPGGPRTPILR